MLIEFKYHINLSILHKGMEHACSLRMEHSETTIQGSLTFSIKAWYDGDKLAQKEYYFEADVPLHGFIGRVYKLRDNVLDINILPVLWPSIVNLFYIMKIASFYREYME